MAEFTWTGINSAGKKIMGRVNARNKKSAISSLTLENIIILSIKRNYHFEFSKRFSKKDSLVFSETLLLLLQSGITLSDALQLLSTSDETKKFELLLKTLHQDLNSGLRFSQTLEKFPAYFNHTYCAMISAAEQSGAFTNVLSQLIENQKTAVTMQKKIKKALFYPLTILVISFIVCAGLLIFVIPQFSKIYSNFGATLPPMTQHIINMSQLLTNHWFFAVLLCITFLLLFKKMNLTQFLIKLPFFKRVQISYTIMQWSQIMAMTLDAHLHLIDALTLANLVPTDKKIKNQLNLVKNAVIAGEKLHHALHHCSHFPKHARHFIAIGENADALPLMMEKVAHYYTQKFDDLLDHLSKLIEPVIMIFVASLVSGLIVAMYLPVFKMGSVI